MKNAENKIIWTQIKRQNYNIYYSVLPKTILGYIITEDLIQGVNPCLESEIYKFNNIKELEEFFEDFYNKNRDF